MIPLVLNEEQIDVQVEADDLNVIRNLNEEDYEDEDKVIEVIKIENNEDKASDDEDKTSKNVQVVETFVTMDMNVLPVTQDRPINVSSLIARTDDNG